MIGAVIVAFAAIVSGCTGGPPAENKAAADELTAIWAKAFNSGDAAALAALYADDARSTPPGGPPAVGRTQIETYWRDDLKTGGEVTKLTADGSMAQGNLLHVSGAYDVTAKGGMTLARGQYDQLWKRDNGQWKVQSEMWRIDPTSQRDPELASQLESQWTNAYNAGNASALAALYNNDAVLSTRPSGSIEGKEAIEFFWKDDFGTGKPTTKLALTDVYLAGDMAHLEGEYEVKDKNNVTKGHYVQLWMQDGEAWRIHREVWWQ
jgi:uncharacterized protein (TIGR02246 family)